MSRRKFSKEFKREAVRLLETSGRSQNQIARELGVHGSVLWDWKQKVEAEKKTGLTTSEQEELAKLRRELDRVRMENEFLKKAAAFFAKESK